MSVIVDNFAGINNKLPATRLKWPTRTDPTCDLVACSDYDLDDSGRAYIRPGFSQILSVAGAHSGFSAFGLFLYVKSGVLLRFDPSAQSSTVLLSLGSDARTRYAVGAGRIFFTNGAVIGEVKNGAASLFAPTSAPFKAVLPAGQAIAYYRARIYVAKGTTVWISDVKPYSRMDLRHGFKQFPEQVRVLAPTTDGIYVGTERRTYFLNGVNPLKMTLQQVSDDAALDVPVQYIEKEKVKDSSGTVSLAATPDPIVPLIMTADGVCAGLPGGNLLNLTETKYRPAPGTAGASLLREGDYGQMHFIVSYR